MKKKITVILIFILSMASIGAVRAREVYRNETRDVNGVIYHIADGTPFTGKMKDMKDRHYYLDGRPHGKWIKFHPSGSIKSIENWSEGRLNGKYTIYQEDGKKIMETTYLNGKDNGQYILYHTNGKIKMRGQMRNGQAYGVWDHYDENGVATKRTSTQ